MNPDGTFGIEPDEKPEDRKVIITIEVTERDLLFYPQYYGRNSGRGRN